MSSHLLTRSFYTENEQAKRMLTKVTETNANLSEISLEVQTSQANLPVFTGLS